MGHWIELEAADGHRLSAWCAPPAGKPRGGLVIVQEIFGVNAHIRSVCERFAALGYLVVAPSLFDRLQERVELGYSNDDVTQGVDFKNRASMAHALTDTQAAQAWLSGAGKIGIIGYCWGGLVAWMAAARLPGFACAVPYYPGGILEHAKEPPMCPVLAHFGQFDHSIPVGGVRGLTELHANVQIEIYPAGHGFSCDQRASFDSEAARVALARTVSLLESELG